MQRLSGNGIAFIEIDGYVKEYDLGPGQQIIIDTGYLAAMSSTCSVDVVTVPELKICSSVEKVYLTRLLQDRAVYTYRQCRHHSSQQQLGGVGTASK